MGFVRDYKDLIVWQRAMQLAEASARLATAMRARGAGDLRNQILRAATSIPANIAEGHSRAHRKEFLQFLGVSRGSLKELETHLLLAVALHFVREEEVGLALNLAEEVSRMLTVLRRRLDEGARKSLTPER